MDDLLKFFRDHKLAALGVAVFVYVAKFVCDRAKSVVLLDILVFVVGGLVLVAIYRWQPAKSERPATRKSFHRRKRRRHHRNHR